MKKKAWVSLFLTVVLLLTAAVPAFAAAQSERVQTEAKTVAVASGKDAARSESAVAAWAKAQV